VITILCKDKSEYKVLSKIKNKLKDHDYNIIVDHAKNNTCFDYDKKLKKLGKKKSVWKPADPVLHMLFQKIGYRYKKEVMEDFFIDPRLRLVFKLLAPIIIKEGHHIC
jgi:hypothetical protein